MIPAHGVKLHVVTAGPEGGKPVLLLHGFPEFWYGWRMQIPALAEAGYRVWAPDQRGYNLSDKPPDIRSYSRDILAEDVVELIKKTGHPKATVIGHDWGGVVAWWLAGKYPEFLEKLIVINAPHPKVMSKTLKKSWQQKFKSWYMVFFQVPLVSELLISRRRHYLLAKAMTGSAKPNTFSSEDMEKYRTAWSQTGSTEAMLAWYRAAFRIKLKPPADPEIKIPTLLLWGEEDHFLGNEMAQASVDLCSRGKLVFIEDATHWVQHEKPGRVNEEILNFLARPTQM